MAQMAAHTCTSDRLLMHPGRLSIHPCHLLVHPGHLLFYPGRLIIFFRFSLSDFLKINSRSLIENWSLILF